MITIEKYRRGYRVPFKSTMLTQRRNIRLAGGTHHAHPKAQHSPGRSVRLNKRLKTSFGEFVKSMTVQQPSCIGTGVQFEPQFIVRVPFNHSILMVPIVAACLTFPSTRPTVQWSSLKARAITLTSETNAGSLLSCATTAMYSALDLVKASPIAQEAHASLTQ